MKNLLHEFFNSKSDANKFLTAEQQEGLENDYQDWFLNKTIEPIYCMPEGINSKEEHEEYLKAIGYNFNPIEELSFCLKILNEKNKNKSSYGSRGIVFTSNEINCLLDKIGLTKEFIEDNKN